MTRWNLQLPSCSSLSGGQSIISQTTTINLPLRLKIHLEETFAITWIPHESTVAWLFFGRLPGRNNCHQIISNHYLLLMIRRKKTGPASHFLQGHYFRSHKGSHTTGGIILLLLLRLPRPPFFLSHHISPTPHRQAHWSGIPLVSLAISSFLISLTLPCFH